jgi:chemotaxis family two-component system sensor kinase Cph1
MRSDQESRRLSKSARSNSRSPSPLSTHLARLSHGHHVCSFHKSQNEGLALAAVWIKEGLARGETGVCVVGDRTADDFIKAMSDYGIDVDSERELGNLLFVSKRDWRYDSDFDPKLMADHVRKIVGRIQSVGNRGLWIAVDMSWALDPNIRPESLAKWEAIWNDLLMEMPVVLLHQYAEERFAPEFLELQFRTHPFYIQDGQIYPSPYYNTPAVADVTGG